MNLKRKSIVIGAVAALGLAVLGAAVLPGRWLPEKPVAIQSVSIAIVAQLASGPVMIAKERNFFMEQGLDVRVTTHNLGRQALAALVKGEAEVAITTDLPLAAAILAGEPIELLATLYSSSAYQSVLALKERSVLKLADLRGKRVGVAFDTSSQYLLETMLSSVGLSSTDVTFVNTAPKDALGELQTGKIDAAMLFPPYRTAVRNEYGDKLLEISDSAVYSLNFHLVARKGFAQDRADAAARMMKALLVAREFIREDPPRALQMIAEKTGKRPDELVDDRRLMADFRLNLGQSTVISLEDHMRWLNKKAKVGPVEMPNVLNHIAEHPLAAVAPAAVRLVR